MMSSDNPKQIRQDMALTRVKIDETLDEIGHRVSPSTLEAAAKRGMRHARAYVEAEAEVRLAGAANRVNSAGRSTQSFIRSHPLAASVMGIGVGLLLARVAHRPKVTPLPPIKEKEIVLK